MQRTPVALEVCNTTVSQWFVENVFEHLIPNFYKKTRVYVRNRTEMAKKQHIDEPFTMIICTVMVIIDCLSTVVGRKHN